MQPNNGTEAEKLQILRAAYDDAVDTINAQVKGHRELAMQALKWIVCARRPLSPIELQHALATQRGDSDLDRDRITDVEDIVDCCHGLVMVDQESRIIRLVHFTTQEYFDGTRAGHFPDADLQIASICMTYGSFGPLEDWFSETPREHDVIRWKARSAEVAIAYPLCDYITTKGAHHLRQAKRDKDEVISFLESLQFATLMDRYKSENFPSGYVIRRSESGRFLGLQVAACYDITFATEHFVERDGPDMVDYTDTTSLMIGAAEGNQTSAKILLDLGADPTLQDSAGRDALWHAVRHQRHSLAEILLDRCNELEDGKCLRLMYQILNGRDVGMAKIFSDRGLEAGLTDNEGASLLSMSADLSHGNEELVKLYLSSPIDINGTDRRGNSALHYAVRRETTAASISSLLIEHGANTELANHRGRTPLLEEILSRQYEAAVVLVRKGANVNAEDNGGNSALSLAVDDETAPQSPTIQMLLENGADVNHRDKAGMTSLHLVGQSYTFTRSHRAGIMELLLRHRADINCISLSGQTPLHRMGMNGYFTGCLMLLENGADSKVVDKDGFTPLSYAFRSLRALVEGSISRRALTNPTDIRFSSPQWRLRAMKGFVDSPRVRSGLLWWTIDPGDSSLRDALKFLTRCCHSQQARTREDCESAGNPEHLLLAEYTELDEEAESGDKKDDEQVPVQTRVEKGAKRFWAAFSVTLDLSSGTPQTCTDHLVCPRFQQEVDLMRTASKKTSQVRSEWSALDVGDRAVVERGLLISQREVLIIDFEQRTVDALPRERWAEMAKRVALEIGVPALEEKIEQTLRKPKPEDPALTMEERLETG